MFRPIAGSFWPEQSFLRPAVVVDGHGVGLVLCEDLRVSMVHNSDIVMVGEQNIRRDGVVGFTAGEGWRQDGVLRQT